MHGNLEEFRKYREQMNEKILASGNLQIQRFFNLDTRAYEEGALPAKTKELLGLVASMVLRCDGCVTYHVTQCVQQGVTDRLAHFLTDRGPSISAAKRHVHEARADDQPLILMGVEHDGAGPSLAKQEKRSRKE